MNQKTKKILVGIVLAVGIILLCALCYFASSAASTESGDKYSDGVSTSSSTSSSADDMTSRAQEEASNIPDDEKKDFEEIDIDEYLDLYEGDENAIVLFSRPTCGYCQEFLPVINEYAGKNHLPAYILEIDTMDSDDVNNILSSLSYFEENTGWGTPLTLAIKDKKVITELSGYTDDTTSIENLYNPAKNPVCEAISLTKI